MKGVIVPWEDSFESIIQYDLESRYACVHEMEAGLEKGLILLP